MNPLKVAIVEAVKAMRGIPYFPQDDDVHMSIMTAISRFADSPEGVKWMAQKAVDHMTAWAGVPELRGIYCAGGFKPADGRHERCTIPALIESRPAYHEFAPVMQKRLPEPEPDPVEEAKFQADIKELQERIDRALARKAQRRILFDKTYKPGPDPEWLQKPN